MLLFSLLFFLVLCPGDKPAEGAAFAASGRYICLIKRIY